MMDRRKPLMLIAMLLCPAVVACGVQPSPDPSSESAVGGDPGPNTGMQQGTAGTAGDAADDGTVAGAGATSGGLAGMRAPGSGAAGGGSAGTGMAGGGGAAGEMAGSGGSRGAGSGAGEGAARPCAASCPSGTLCADGSCSPELSGIPELDAVLLGDSTPFDTQILISQQPDQSYLPSTIYRWRDFVQAVHAMHVVGVGEFRLWFGEPADPDAARARYGLVNLAAFLAQSMKETIKYDACDENNWDASNGYLISNACGQLGQDYASYDCEMACPRDPGMALTAVTHAKWYGAPGPLFCAPDATLIAAGLSSDGRTGRWDYSSDCHPYPASEPDFTPSDAPAYTRPDCELYAGQRAGRYVWDGSGQSVEGCCWWGRGVIQTTGRCNFGTLNHYLGQSHLDASVFPRDGDALYPDLDFCKNPEAICSSTAHPELKWIAGLFYWMSSVEPYERDGWAYKAQLRAFVDSGLTDPSFIDAVSGIVNRGCHNPPCGSGPVDGADERRANFEKVLTAMGLR